jgi:hypothetical protein
MSGANADPRDPQSSIDEWRVDAGEPAQPEPAGTHPASDWSEAETSLRRARVRADISSWREELGERIRRFEDRLHEAGNGAD